MIIYNIIYKHDVPQCPRLSKTIVSPCQYKGMQPWQPLHVGITSSRVHRGPCHRPRACWMPSAGRSFSRARSQSRRSGNPKWSKHIQPPAVHIEMAIWSKSKPFQPPAVHIEIYWNGYCMAIASIPQLARRSKKDARASLSDDVISSRWPSPKVIPSINLT